MVVLGGVLGLGEQVVDHLRERQRADVTCACVCMYTCVYIYMRVQIDVYTHIHTHLHANTHECMHACMRTVHTCEQPRVHTCVQISVHVCVSHALLHARMHTELLLVRGHICTQVCVCVCVCVCVGSWNVSFYQIFGKVNVHIPPFLLAS